MNNFIKLILILSTIIYAPLTCGAEEGDSNNMKYEKVILAGGCFWCTESVFKGISGVVDAVAGYTGGNDQNPTYQEVGSGVTGHYEAVEVTYDPAQISFENVLNVFWRDIDPTDAGGQFADRGSQYRTAIFYTTDEQKTIAEKSKDQLGKSGMFDKPIVTQILKAEAFYPAENYHQDYAQKNPDAYGRYRSGSGRQQYLEKKWNNSPKICPLPKKISLKTYNQSELKEKLTPLQFSVTQENSTEPAFRNEYWNNKKEGIYVDVVSGEPLFSSKDKFDSGTGWPSFTKPLESANVLEKSADEDSFQRVEVRSKNANSHLGHVFDDGPRDTGGMRYCINSASMRFIPKEDLEKEGYGQYKKLFE